VVPLDTEGLRTSEHGEDRAEHRVLEPLTSLRSGAKVDALVQLASSFRSYDIGWMGSVG
jgi:hypothetical protein